MYITLFMFACTKAGVIAMLCEAINVRFQTPLYYIWIDAHIL